MEKKAYIQRIKSIHEHFLDYIDNTSNNEKEHIEFLEKISYSNLLGFKHELKDLLYLISRISANYHRSPHLFPKIKRIILQMKPEITENFINLEIFNIFEKCKKMLLFLFNERIIIPDRSIFNIITDYKHTKHNYPTFFYYEFKNYFDKKPFLDEIDSFEEKRQLGENESYICELIRNDSIDDFIIHVNKYNISLNSLMINDSIFETNPLLVGKKLSLIEYASFFGSIQIYQYLRLNQVDLKSSLWIYAIHGKNPELFHLLEEDHVTLCNEMKAKCFKESIKCHHNDFTEYIQYNFFDNIDQNAYLIDKIKHHNFLSLPDEIASFDQFFFYFCKYDYFQIVKFLLDEKNIDVNKTQIKVNKNKKDGYEIIFKDLYDDITKFYREENTPLCVSIKKGNKEIVQLLLEQKNINVDKCFIDTFVLGCDNENERKTPLLIAVENENLEIVQLLMQSKKVSINFRSEYATYSEELGGILMSKKTPLHVAVEKQNIEILQCLLKEKNLCIDIIEKINLDHIQFFEKTALHIAIEKGNYEIVQLLLLNNISQSDYYKNYEHVYVSDAPSYNEVIEKKSPLMLALKYRNVKIFWLLLKNLFWKYIGWVK